MYIANCTDDPVEYDSTGGGGGKAPKKPLGAHQVTVDGNVGKDKVVTFFDNHGATIDECPKIPSDEYLVILDVNAQGKLEAFTFVLTKVS